MAIEDRAWKHYDRFPDFNVSRFLAWFRSKPDRWQQWAQNQKISRLNKIRKIDQRVDRRADEKTK